MSNVSRTCDYLVGFCMRRRFIIKKQWGIERPTMQEIRRSLESLTGKHLQHARAEKIRLFLMKHYEEWDGGDIAHKKGFNEQEITVMELHRQNVEVDALSLDRWLKQRKQVESEIGNYARRLPVFEWWDSHRGMSASGLGLIVSETGDLSGYPNPDKVKKRMGLSPYKGRAGSQWRRKGGLTKDEFVELGYNPRRRSTMYVVGDAVIKARGDYRKIYDAEKEKKQAAWPGDENKGRRHAHAQRVMEQQILIDLWCQWNGKKRAKRSGPTIR